MDTFLLFFIALILALVIGFVVVKISGNRNGPSSPTEAHRESITGTEDGHPNIPRYPTGSRPGGPGVEAMNAAEPGGPTPGEPDEEADANADALKPSEAARTDLDEDR